jgi:uncharacterized delta-60 repeat protein
MVNVKRSILYLFFLTLLYPVIASAVVPGYFDTTFNTPNGFAAFSTPFMYGERPTAVAIQGDGKIVVVDTHGDDSGRTRIAVIRYNRDGSLDSTFNHPEGVVLYNHDNVLSFATDVAIQSDGKIVVAGFRSQVAQNWYDIMVLRYNTDGSLDTSFSGGEVVFTNNVEFDGVDTVASIAIQNDGKILLATHTFLSGTDTKNLLLLRFNPNGSVDESFGSQGVVQYGYYFKGDVETDDISGRKVKITPDGQVAVLVKVFAFTAMLKFNMEGVLVSESEPYCGQLKPMGYFSGALPRGMEVQQDGKIVVAGEADNSPFALRYTPEGELDTAFGAGTGVISFNYRDHFRYLDEPLRSSSARNIAIQPDGNILLVGTCPMDHDGNMLSDDVDVFLARYATDGAIDTSFGINGLATFDGEWRAGETYLGDIGQAVALQSDGKIIVVGNMRANAVASGDHYDMVVMRFVGQPGPDIEVSPVNYDYGEVPTRSSKIQQFSITNIGQTDLAVSGIDLVYGDGISFLVESGTCQTLTPTIVPGGSCMITVRFVPGSEGLKTSTLRITSNDPYARAITYGPVEVSLQGTGMPVQSNYTLTVITDGDGVGIVQSKPKGIKCGKNWTDCKELYTAGKEIKLYHIIEQEESKFVGWSGACSGKKECKVVMDSDKEVTAIFQSDPTIVVWPRYKDFKNVRTGWMKAAVIFIKNSTMNGRKPLEIGTINIGPQASLFQIFEDRCSGKVLEPREACFFGVLFEPEAVGSFAAEISIPSNDPGSPVTAVQLKGNGAAPPPPKHPSKR